MLLDVIVAEVVNEATGPCQTTAVMDELVLVNKLTDVI